MPTNPALTQREAFASIAAAAGVPMPAVGTMSSRTIRAVGVVVPLIRALGQQLYQFDRPFVIDASETVGDLRPRADAVGRVHPLDPDDVYLPANRHAERTP